jgi:hypothetical protein
MQVSYIVPLYSTDDCAREKKTIVEEEKKNEEIKINKNTHAHIS